MTISQLLPEALAERRDHAGGTSRDSICSSMVMIQVPMCLFFSYDFFSYTSCFCFLMCVAESGEV